MVRPNIGSLNTSGFQTGSMLAVHDGRQHDGFRRRQRKIRA